MFFLDEPNYWGDFPSWVQAILAIVTLILSVVTMFQQKKIKELTDIVTALTEQTKELGHQTKELGQQTKALEKHNEIFQKDHDLRIISLQKELYPNFRKESEYVSGDTIHMKIKNIGHHAYNVRAEDETQTQTIRTNDEIPAMSTYETFFPLEDGVYYIYSTGGAGKKCRQKIIVSKENKTVLIEAIEDQP